MSEFVSIPPIKEANRITRLWRDHGPNTYPIDLSLVVEHLINPTLDGEKLHLIYSEFDNFEGMLLTENEKKWGAYVNKKIPYKGRKNFTAAHEIFHFLAHRKVVTEFRCGVLDLSDYKVNQLEIEANEFASQLLLPPDKIRPYVNGDFTYDIVKTVADDLGASVSAVAYKWLTLTSKRIAFFQSRDGFVSQGYASTPAYECGIYFKNGKEIPENSITYKSHNNANQKETGFCPGLWHAKLGGHENVHQTSFEDYTYTFLRFY
ncbi:MAG: hypothetical protein NPIRA05_14230 [Nitrospirales bacterium]|nr:MAG: hypothetical protein NPIRA05_14230 [Nitrospirales bacterium]